MAEKKKSNFLSDMFRQAGQELKAVAGKEAIGGATHAKIFNVLEYVEASWGLNMKLFPAQRFIVKLYYNLELDDKLPEDPLKRIRITDPFKTKIIGDFTEKEYLTYLYNEGRCNIGAQDHDRRELVLSIGRRGGKSTLSGVFASYEVYRLLNLYNPQEYYGLPNGNRIQILSVATNKDQAGLLFNEVTSHLAKCEYFKPYIANNTLSHVNFRTPYDIEKYGPTTKQESNGKFQSLNGKASLRVTFKPCIARSLRGFGNVVIILDEVAHFQDKGGSSAKEVYTALEPSTAAFSRKNPITGRTVIDPTTGREERSESRIILISSPLGREGLFYERYDLAMRGGEGARNLLAIQAPTWEINPNVTADVFTSKFHADPSTFVVEFGAQFSEQFAGWIERASDLEACIDPARRPVLQARPRLAHQMGVDLGLVGDGTAICITHNDGDKIVVDYHEIWQAGVDWCTSNPHLVQEGQKPPYPTDYARSLVNVERLDFDEIANWIETICKRFYITKGLFDRYSGIVLEQALHKKGLKQFTSEFFTRDQTSKMYGMVKGLVYHNRLSLYDWPIPEKAREGNTKHGPFIAELLSLQAKMISKNIVLVEAPKTEGAHDDLADAFIRSVWLSMERQMNSKHIGNSETRPVISSTQTADRYQMARSRYHGAPSRPSGKSLGRALMAKGRVR